MTDVFRFKTNHFRTISTSNSHSICNKWGRLIKCNSPSKFRTLTRLLNWIVLQLATRIASHDNTRIISISSNQLHSSNSQPSNRFNSSSSSLIVTRKQLCSNKASLPNNPSNSQFSSSPSSSLRYS